MAQVYIFANGEALGVLVGQDDGARGFGLADDVGGSRVVQEAVVDAARIPCVDALRAAERCVADQRMAPSIVVAGIVMRSVVVFL